MRTFTALLTVGTLMAATMSQTIEWRKDLSCGACAIGGYRFCYDNKNSKECCKVDDAACLTRYKFCSGEDKFKAVLDTCGSSNWRDMAVCGNNGVIHITNTTTPEIFNIT